MRRLFYFCVGVGLGIGLALLIGWGLFPVQRANSSPAMLRRDYQEEYIRLIAAAYQVDGNLTLARQRLAALQAASPTAPLVEVTERWIAQGKSTAILTPLVQLARDLGVNTPAMQPYLQGGTP
ncbi:MAG TPA: hypothetical protein PLJ78_04585 [Anaerolineae bacterium]|nr:hypothetical protein [Anaerolineae bacterium]HQK13210.1 hypothetical protein [Anaerolineae bacterium]